MPVNTQILVQSEVMRHFVYIRIGVSNATPV
jgi:hypothetical protein